MLKLFIMILIGLLIALFNGDIKKLVSPQHLDTSNVFANKLADRLQVELNRQEIPGLQIAVIKDDQLTQLALGTADFDRIVPLTHQHVFRLGSITSLYTATVIMRLIEQEQLKLESTIEVWFPGLPYAEEITVKNLLNHTSGIYNYTENLTLQMITALHPRKQWLPTDLANYVLSGKPYFAPGSSYYYSNSNYLLLGLIAEKITSKNFAELVEQWILQPHTLESTYFLPADSIPSQLITGYQRDLVTLGTKKHLPSNKTWSSLSYTAGSMASTASETAHFLQRLFSHQILKKETLEQMLQFNLSKDFTYPDQNGYGLGISRFVLENDTLWGGTVTISGFGGAAFYCKERNYYIVVLGNLSSLKQTQLVSTIIQTIHEVDYYGTGESKQLAHAG